MSDAVYQARELLADPPIGVEVWGPIVEGLLGELERLHTWDGLMSLADEHYPTDIFPHLAGQPDDPDRDPGPRILLLIREVDRLRAIDADLAKARNVIEQVREHLWKSGPFIASDGEWSYRMVGREELLAILADEAERGEGS